MTSGVSAVAAACGVGCALGSAEGAAALGAGRGRVEGCAVGAGVTRTAGAAGGVIVGTAVGAGCGWLARSPGRTTGFAPSTGPCSREAVGAAVGSGKLQVLADCASAGDRTGDTVNTVAESAAAVAAREMVLLLPLMTLLPSPNSL
ncbi:hypothetical protein [Novosphingobium barchaimii]|uniref:hypothetical protein n=1 Tax=Novosphingobium barchaimii TaxID=1420591 RepID=UPI0011DF6679|nr:hypothetical protein [Novosphingobium barchaimii]